MMKIKLLFIEDDSTDIDGCRTTVAAYEHEKGVQIELVVAKDIAEATEKMSQAYDGAIVDLKLGANAGEGNAILNQLRDNLYRMPVVILTGTPDDIDTTYHVVRQCKKGEVGYREIFDLFFSIYKTGLTKIIGGRGEIERFMSSIFEKNIMPSWEMWTPYANHGMDTEKALLRFVVSHLIECLDAGTDMYFKEEVYITPPPTTNFKTGSILSKKETHNKYVVLNPACDIATRQDGAFKTDRILLAEIEPMKDVLEMSAAEVTKRGKKKRRIEEAIKNNHTDYYHWLPNVAFFDGGFINFRKVSTFTKQELENNFELPPKLQISSPFVKDVVSRFSSFYARQGQPDLNFPEIAKCIDTCMHGEPQGS